MLDRFFPLYAMIFLFSFLITVFLEKRLIPSLREKAKQPIYEEGPKWHIKKSGTPTMGGMAFLLAIIAAISLSLPILIDFKGGGAAISIMLCLGYAALNSFVGILDDTKKLRKKENRGLTPAQKLIFQFSLAALFLYLRILLLGDDTKIAFSFGEIDLGLWYYPIALITLVGIINFANLTDGIDGLASSVAFSVSVSLLYISAALVEEAAMLSSAIIGSAVGFLVFNLHPAKIFMGDTGSLFFGALIASFGFILDNPFIIIFVAGVYVLEGLSVIIQVLVFKLCKKRVFKMAPFHHHLEQCGWSENKICIVAILLTFIFSIPAYIFYLP